MPPDMAVSMRHTKLKAEEAALIAGELTKPSWESRNEGIHERVSFEDTIWGFDLAGGIYYRTPLRVTFVKPDSRAEKAGIKPGDRLLRINDIDTSTLTIQQAHDLIVESGIHLKLAVTSPDDLEDAYYYYEDPIVEDYDSEEERLREEEKARKRQVHARVSSYWSLQWPWVSKRKIIYRESNCYLVPSKYEEKHRDKFPPQPMQRFQDDIVLHSAKDTSKNRVRGEKLMEEKNQLSTEPNTKLTNGVTNGHEEEEEEDNNTAINEDDSQEDLSLKSSGSDTIQNDEVINDNVVNKDENEPISQESETSDKPNDKEEEEEEKVNAEETDAMDVLEESSNGFQDLSQEMIKDNDLLKAEDDNNIIDSILSDNGQNMENLEAMNER